MNHLFIINNAECKPYTHELSRRGIKQAKDLSISIANRCRDESLRIISSTSLYSISTAEVISDNLCSDYETKEELFADSLRKPDYDRIQKLIDNPEQDSKEENKEKGNSKKKKLTVILIANDLVSNGFSDYFLEEMKKSHGVNIERINPGEGVYFTLEKEDYEILKENGD